MLVGRPTYNGFFLKPLIHVEGILSTLGDGGQKKVEKKQWINTRKKSAEMGNHALKFYVVRIKQTLSSCIVALT